MSNKPIAEDIRLRLAQSMPVVERSRAAISSMLRERVQTLEGAMPDLRQAEIKTTMLMDLLIAGASDIAAFGGLRELSRTAREHRKLAIDGRHYSRFGLALAPALRQAPGLALSPMTIAAWCDAFWLIIAEVVADPAPKPSPSGTLRFA